MGIEEEKMECSLLFNHREYVVYEAEGCKFQIRLEFLTKIRKKSRLDKGFF